MTDSRQFARHIILTVFLLMAANPAIAVESFDVDDLRDTAYLPYACTALKASPSTVTRCDIYHRAALFQPATDSTPPYIISVGNPALGSDNPAVFARLSSNFDEYIDEDPIRLIVSDFHLFHDSAAGLTGVLGAGYKRDSAWAFSFYPEREAFTRKLLLGTGADSTGDGYWDPSMYIATVEDYDLDGNPEAFIYLNVEREKGVRALYCVELLTLRLEWSLPLAAPLQCYRWRNFVVFPDNSEPRIVFVTHNPLQGRTDSNYDDKYKYLSILNGRGELIYNRIVCSDVKAGILLKHPVTDDLFLLHQDPLEAESLQKEYPAVLSRITFSGELIATRGLNTDMETMWFGPFDHPSSPCLFVRDNDGIVTVYDTSLTEIARSGRCNLRNYITSVPIDGHDSVLVFASGLYTPDYGQLAAVSCSPSTFAPFTTDSLGLVESFLTGGRGSYSVYGITAKPWWALADAFYVKNQVYVLAVLSSLLVGLVLVNYHRRRTRRNLDTIAGQKAELEEVHRALKEAQAQLVAQEKFRQAQDIAGGFAHEIRNALFPARTALSRLLRQAEVDDLTADRASALARFTTDAVSRAVEMTETVSKYTSLQAEQEAGPVLLNPIVAGVIDLHNHRIEAKRVSVTVKGDEKIQVNMNREHLHLVLANLLTNALDAVEDATDPAISMVWSAANDRVALLVTDNGSGIAEEHRDRIFDMFFTTKPATGSGLGLALIQRILDLYNASISLDGLDKNGTTFRLLLPASENENIHR